MISFEQIYVKNLNFIEKVNNNCWRRIFKLSKNVSHSLRVKNGAMSPLDGVVNKIAFDFIFEILFPGYFIDMSINSPQFERNLAIIHSCVSFVNKALYTCYLHSWTKWKLSYFSFEKTRFNWGKFKLCVINLWIFTAKLLVPNIHQNFLNLVESQ